MTASATITSLAPAIRKRATRRGHHSVADTPEMRRKLKDFGRAVAVLRKKKGLTVLGLSVAVGISDTQVCNIEAGNNWPSVPVLINLCGVLGVKLPPMME